MGSRKRYWWNDTTLPSRIVHTKRKLDRVTIICFVNTAGEHFMPVVLYQGKQLHFRSVDGGYETVLEDLATCYVFQRDPLGVYGAYVSIEAHNLSLRLRFLGRGSTYL